MSVLNKRKSKLNQSIVQKADDYLKMRKHQLKPSTYGIYRHYIDSYIAPHFEEAKLKKLTAEAIQEFVNGCSEKGLSPSTIAAIFFFLRNSLKSAYEIDIFQIKLPKQIHKKIEVLSIKEQKFLEIIAKSTDESTYIGIILSLYCGLRIGELCGLLWNDVDFEKRLIFVRRTLQRIKNIDSDAPTKTKVTSLLPKSESSQRNIPLPDFLYVLLDDFKQKSGMTASYVLSIDGKCIEPRIMQFRFKKLLLKAEMRSVNFHILRHTFATRALENGFDIKTLSEILGHSSAAFTMKRYAHTLDEHKRIRMESLTALYQQSAIS
ncbi:MAG: site-specific integrase [Lachnospiraceae bacterium]|nr:site-specific integrase [Lachnospiraceae bacterium]